MSRISQLLKVQTVSAVTIVGLEFLAKTKPLRPRSQNLAKAED